MNPFDSVIDEALGYNSAWNFGIDEEENPFDSAFDEAYEDSVVMPYDDIIGSFLTRRSIEPLGMMEEEDMGFGQQEPRIPSRALPESEFRVGGRTRRQDIAELGAITELDRNVALFKQLGLHEEFEAEVEEQNDSLGFDHIIEPVFDFLSVGNYTIAGGIEEYLLTNSPIAGLQQAGEEFLNAIGFDMEGARRTTWSDLLSGRRGDTALTVDKDSPFATAAGGFVLDVLLDPTTWFGFGLGKVAVGIGKVDEVAGGLAGIRRISDLATNSNAGKTYRRLFMPMSLLKGLKEGHQAEEIAGVVNRLSKEQGAKLVTAEDVKEGTVNFMAQIIRKDAAVSMQTVALRENILKVGSEMNEGELRLVGAYLDQPEVVDGLITELKVDDATKGVLRKGVEEWRDVFNKIFDAEEEVGLLDRAQFRANYSAGMEPITELSRAIVENMFKVRFGKDAGSAMYERAAQEGIATITENGIMKASYAKKYPTLESRIHDLVPTETNAALMATRRGMESIKKVNTQKFYDTTISDTRIAVPIDQFVAENLRDPTHQMLKEHGMAVWKAPALSVRKQTRQASGTENIYYAIPSAMKEQLDDMTKLIQGSDETSKLVSTFRQVQGLWKAYALLSPGYHMRNLYSNVFNNYLAGVTNPKRYAEAMLLQVEDTANIGSRAVRSKLERILGGRKTSADYMFELPDGQKLSGAEVKLLADERGVTQAGMIYNESDLGIGEDLMTNLQMRTGRPTTSEISEGLSDWGDREARIANVKSSLFKAVREAGGDLSEEQAEKTAEVYDVIARAWAWKNWKTPEEWYEQRIREIKAYTVPTAGTPEAGLDFLHQTKIPGIDKIDYANPNFKKAAEGSFYVRRDGTMPLFLHGTPSGALRKSGFVDPKETGGQHMGPGFYMTMDFLPYDPQRGPQVTTGYMQHLGKESTEIAAYYAQQKAIPRGAPGSLADASGIYESIPELVDELKRFKHDDLIPEGVVTGTPWSPIGPSDEQLALLRNRKAKLMDSVPDGPLKESYENYIFARESMEDLLWNEEALFALEPDLAKAQQRYSDLLREDLIESQAEGLGDFSGTRLEWETGRMGAGGEFFTKVKPPDDDTLRELVALERYENQWTHKNKWLTEDVMTREGAIAPDVLGFHWFAKNPFVLSTVAQDGKSYKQLRLGETLSNPTEAITGRGGRAELRKQDTEFSIGQWDKEVDGITEAAAEVLSAIYTRAAKKGIDDPSLLRKLDPLEAFAPEQLDALNKGIWGRTNNSLKDLKKLTGYKNIKKVFKEDVAFLDRKAFTTEDEINKYTELALKYINGKSGTRTLESIMSDGTEAFGNLAMGKGLSGNQQLIYNDLLQLWGPRWAQKYDPQAGDFFTKNKTEQDLYDYYHSLFKGSIDDNIENLWDDAEAAEWDRIGEVGEWSPDESKLLQKKVGIGEEPYSSQMTKEQFLGVGAHSDGYYGLSAAITEASENTLAHTKNLSGDVNLLREAAHELGYTDLLYKEWDDEDLFVGGLDFAGGMWIMGESLKKAGYDGLSHAGGMNDVTGLFHQVGIAYNPNTVKSIENIGTWNLGTNKFLEQHGDDGLYGAIHFLDDGRADILATEGANPTTFIHEMAHLIRRTMLDEGDKDIIHRWVLGENQYKIVRAEMVDHAEEAARMAPRAEIDIDEMATQLMERFVWTVDEEEVFARSFEQFLMEGVTDKNAGRAMQGTFDYMKEMMDTVYDFSNKGRVGLTPNEETNYLFQNILGRGVETEAERLALPTAILETATSGKESFFSKAYGMLGDNMLTRGNRNFGQQMENNSRLAHFITMMTTDKGKIQGNGLLNKKTLGEGMNADEAAQSVKRFLFDYGELTPFERDYMKTIIPFYTWMRKNIPLQFQMIAQQPERYSAVPKLQHALEAMSAEWEGIPTPDYFDDINAMRMPVTSEALPLNDSGMPLYFAPDLPYGDLNRLNMKDMVSSMTPFLKTWAEIYPKTGYSFFLDSEIQEYQDQAAVADVFGESVELPFNEKTWHAIKTLLPPVGKAARLGQRASEGKITEQLLREVMGLNFRSVDVDAVVRAKRFQRREVARAIKQRLIDKVRLMGFEDALEDLQED